MSKSVVKRNQLSAARFAFVRMDKRLLPGHRLVVMEILDHDFAVAGTGGALRKGEAWPTQQRLEGRLGISRRTIRTAERNARNLGYWRMKKIPNGGGRWKFLINYPRINSWVLQRLEEEEGKDCSSLRKELAAESEKPVPTKLPKETSRNKPLKNVRRLSGHGGDARKLASPGLGIEEKPDQPVGLLPITEPLERDADRDVADWPEDFPQEDFLQ